MTKVNPKEHYRRMNANTPAFSFRVDKEKIVKFEKIAKNLQMTRSMLGRAIMNLIIKKIEEKKLEINSDKTNGSITMKFHE